MPAGVAPPILIVRHPTVATRFYDVVLDWARTNAPECLERIAVATLPFKALDTHALKLLVLWLQDPVQAWSQGTYNVAEALADHCQARAIPVVNRARHLVNAGKAEAARRIAASGLRTPRMALIDDMAAFRRDVAGLAFPFFVREDWGHGGDMLRVDTPAQARDLPLERFRRPVAIELVDVRDPRDGLFRKYRYFAVGEQGVAQHLQVSRTWITRGTARVFDDATRVQELDYVGRQDPHHARFQAARRALELDMVAFDYGYRADGEVVVWEVNPFPRIAFGQTTSKYRNVAIHRSIAAMLACYHARAGFAVPERLLPLLRY